MGQGMGPEFSLMMLAVMLIIGAKGWRERRLRRAMRDLPTLLQRQLGDGPDYAPPPDLPDELTDFAALHRRTERVQTVIWVLAGLWLAYVLYLMMGTSG